MREQYHIDLNVGCINKYRAHSTAEQNKAQDKEYYQANKETILEQKKEYREANKEALLEQRKVKITCSCGAVISKCKKSIHERTKKHIS